MTTTPWVLALAGPTASGKSAVALALARRAGAEIVSADSVQVYRGLEIGSAKPTAEERAEVPHHGLDLLSPAERGDAMRWAAHAADAMRDALGRGRPVIVVGGTGLYFRALFSGLSEMPEIPEAVRTAVHARLDAEGVRALHAELATVDPATAAAIAPEDRQRVARALEVLMASGRPLSAWQAQPPRPVAAGIVRQDAVAFWTLTPERGPHRDAIARRAARMVEEGLVDEVAALLAEGLSPDAPGLQSLGYRSVVAAITAGAVNRDALVEAVAQGHVRYAKRQRTWFEGSAGAPLGWRAISPADALARPAALLELRVVSGRPAR